MNTWYLRTNFLRLSGRVSSKFLEGLGLEFCQSLGENISKLWAKLHPSEFIKCVKRQKKFWLLRVGFSCNEYIWLIVWSFERHFCCKFWKIFFRILSEVFIKYFGRSYLKILKWVFFRNFEKNSLPILGRFFFKYRIDSTSTFVWVPFRITKIFFESHFALHLIIRQILSAFQDFFSFPSYETKYPG